MSFRRYDEIGEELLSRDMEEEIVFEDTDHLELLTLKFEYGLKDLLDKHAPVVHKTITVRHKGTKASSKMKGKDLEKI